MRRHHRCRISAAAHVSCLVEPLEQRTLLTGVTIITHGAEFLSSDRPGWIDSMASAIRARLGVNTSIYTIRVEGNGKGGVGVSLYSRLSGPTLSASNSGETVILLDWAAVSNVNLGSGAPDFSTTQVAAAVVPFLTAARPNIGMTAPVVEGPIQLIGHSRGASLNSEIARLLGQQGIWVEQLTSLDSVPVPPDPATAVRSNIIFADNYYENNSLTAGGKITGAYNVGPLSLGGAYGFLDGGQHGDVHLFYHGTINLGANAGDGSETVKNSWYAGNHLARNATGFYFSRLGGGAAARPAQGVGTAFGGTGARGKITHSGAQWPNMAMLTVPGSVLAAGQPFAASYRYNSLGAAATIDWFVDPDTNPYNNNSIAISGDMAIAATADGVFQKTTMLTADTTNVPLGTYYLEGRIKNSTGTRYAYSGAISFATAPPAGAIDQFGPSAVDGYVIDPDTPTMPVTVRLDVDGVTFATQSADLAHAGLPDADGPNHGYSIDLTSLSPGMHKVELYAVDTDSGAAILQKSQMVSVNRAPIGAIESFDGATVTGYALDLDAGASAIQIFYSVDGNAPLRATANVAHAAPAEAPGAADHGFSVSLPQLTAGTHTVSVWAEDSTSRELTLLGSQEATVSDPVDNILATGHLDSATGTKVTGWAADGNVAGQSIMARIDVDGVAGTPFLAKLSKSKLKKTVGSTKHGFSQKIKLTPGQHRLDVYAMDDQGIAVLLGSRIVNTARPLGAINTLTAALVKGWAYSAAVPNTSPTVRVDIDGLPGAAFVTDVLRKDINAARHITGSFGFNVALPVLTSGTHSVTLEYMDPLTDMVTAITSQSLVIV